MSAKCRLVWLAPGLLALAGCGLDHGVVTAKTHKPESTYLMTTINCNGYPNQTCTPEVHPETDPECWGLALRDGNDTGSVCIDQARWDRVQVGQHYGDRDE
jgi:hypothetical protein